MKFSCVYSISNAIGSHNQPERLRVLTISALETTSVFSPAPLRLCLAWVCVCVLECVCVCGKCVCVCVCLSLRVHVCVWLHMRARRRLWVCRRTEAPKQTPPLQTTRCGGSSDNERYTYSPALGGGEALGLPASQLCCASSPIESTPVYAASASVSVCQSSQPLCRFLAR